ncbi:MAG: hypothetical protein FWD94_06320 [Treponema sp.]|nr:hypothetical protein [Treponema sp.]
MVAAQFKNARKNFFPKADYVRFPAAITPKRNQGNLPAFVLGEKAWGRGQQDNEK